MAKASTGGATQRAIGMRDVDIQFMAALQTFSAARARHQLGRRARRFELEQFAHPAPSLAFLSLARIDAGEGPQTQCRQSNESFGVGLSITAGLLKTCDGRIIE
jgi:hypothetical protein